MKTSELTGVALDWAVTVSLGKKVKLYRQWLETENEYWKGRDCSFANNEPVEVLPDNVGTAPIPKYSTDWSQGGPIIERELIRLSNDGSNLHCAYWAKGPEYWAETPLIAAMRCYVASKLGDEVEIPGVLK